MKKNYLFYKICVGALIKNKQGEVLLVKKNYGIFKGLWTLPEGYAQNDETPAKALARELKEELGVEIKVGHLIAVRFRKTLRENTAYFIFRAEILNLNNIKVDSQELASFEFMNRDKILADKQVYSLVKFILSQKESESTSELKASNFLPVEISVTGGDYVLYL